MTDERNEANTQLRRYLAWTAAGAMALGTATALWTGLIGFSGWHLAPPSGMNPGVYVSGGLLAATAVAIVALLGGVVVLAVRSSRDDEGTTT